MAKKNARFYDEQLREEINADRIAHGRKPLKEKTTEEDTGSTKAMGRYAPVVRILRSAQRDGTM